MTRQSEQLFEQHGPESYIFPGLVALLIFGTFAVLQANGLTQTWDESVLLSLRTTDQAVPVASGWMLPFMTFITWFGDVTALIIISAIAATAMFLRHRNEHATLLLLSALGGVILMFVLKEGFARPRPDVVPALVHVSTLSFPSGHALMSVTVYVPVILVLLRTFPRYAQYFKIALAGFLAPIGFSRMYFGVHYPSDILAGWAMGVFWVIMCHLILAAFRARKTMRGEKQRQDHAGG